MIIVKNRQRKTTIDIDQLRNKVQKMLDLVGCSDFDITVVLTNNKSIHALNLQFRGQDKPTDILSFPFHPELKPGKKIKTHDPEEKNLGDIIISVEYAQQQAAVVWGESFEDHLRRLLAHGIAHLLGHTHETDADHGAMQQLEERLRRV